MPARFFRTASPAPCPWLSLIALKWSMSNMINASGPPVRAMRDCDYGAIKKAPSVKDAGQGRSH